MIVWSHEARFKPVTLWCRHDVTLLIQTMALVFTTPSDEASWAVRVVFFKVDISCRLSGVLTEWFSGMFTPRELLASQSCHWHLCLFLRLLLLLGLNDVAKGKKKERAEADGKQSPHSRELSSSAYYTSCELIQTIVSALVPTLSFVLLLKAARLFGKQWSE